MPKSVLTAVTCDYLELLVILAAATHRKVGIPVYSGIFFGKYAGSSPAKNAVKYAVF